MTSAVHCLCRGLAWSPCSLWQNQSAPQDTWAYSAALAPRRAAACTCSMQGCGTSHRGRERHSRASPPQTHRRVRAGTRAFAARGYGKAYTPQLMAGNATVARPSRLASCRQLLLASQVWLVQWTAVDDIRVLRLGHVRPETTHQQALAQQAIRNELANKRG